MNRPPAHYLILDLEATCCDGGTVPREERETLEIGALMMDARNFEVRSEFQTFVRPVRHPRQDCAFHGVNDPFGDRHLDLKAELSKVLPGARGRKRYGLRQALEMLGMAFEGEPHRGLVDARNGGRVVSAILGRI